MGEEVHVAEEKHTLERLRGSRFVCQLLTSFQDPYAVYLVTEQCNGDLFELFNTTVRLI